MSMIVKMVSDKRGDHIHTIFFMGMEGGTMANCGTLVQDIGEWQILGAAILLGAERTKGRLTAVTAGWTPEKEPA
jgi:hypothetical protein